MLNIDYLNAIKEYMQLHEVKQNRLAKLLQVSANTITNWMNGGVISDRHRVRIFQLCGKPKEEQVAIIHKGNADSGQQDQPKTTLVGLSTILDAIMSSDMCDGCKVKAYAIIKHIVAAPA
jgi:transcriptional regulator with XRE-family HTH domain